MRDFSRFTMTYDLPQQKGPQPRLQVPEGAEVLLEDALPHLSAAQRRTLMVNRCQNCCSGVVPDSG